MGKDRGTRQNSIIQFSKNPDSGGSEMVAGARKKSLIRLEPEPKKVSLKI